MANLYIPLFQYVIPIIFLITAVIWVSNKNEFLNEIHIL